MTPMQGIVILMTFSCLSGVMAFLFYLLGGVVIERLTDVWQSVEIVREKEMGDWDD